MKVGFVGTGKLGLPVSLMYANAGHKIFAYDVNQQFYQAGTKPENLLFDEELDPECSGSLKAFLDKFSSESRTYKHTSLQEVVIESDLIFVAVQTPHEEKYEGVTRIQSEKKDFDYKYLKESVESIYECAKLVEKEITIVIISTVLPGTLRREILPNKPENCNICYNPYFIAMGTVAQDVLHPEFILLGKHSATAAALVKEFYKTICDAPVFETTVENAEMIKVCYNTFISTKIAMANTIMELCHYSPNTDCDEVIDALTLANRRLISNSYLRGGMGDGGGCHPRDNIALSWLSEEKGLSFDWFNNIMLAREKQTEFLANLIISESSNRQLPIAILGMSFKPNTKIRTGSATVLLANLLREFGQDVLELDPLETDCSSINEKPYVIFIGCAHDKIKFMKIHDQSIVIDPHRKYRNLVNTSADRKYIPVGIGT